eukprot:Hpha_TRINITY_DN16203_c0_g1::TRINITY_DN16203_c0_g1_i2::g.11506::m.11506
MAGLTPPGPAAVGRAPSSRQTTLFGSVPSVAAKTKTLPPVSAKPKAPPVVKSKVAPAPPTKAPPEKGKSAAESKKAPAKPAAKKSVNVKDDESDTESVPARKRQRKTVPAECASSEAATPVRPATRSSASPPDPPVPVVRKSIHSIRAGTQASPLSVSSESPQQPAVPCHPFFSQASRALQAAAPKKRGRPPKQDAQPKEPEAKEAEGPGAKKGKEAKEAKEAKKGKAAKEGKEAKKGTEAKEEVGKEEVPEAGKAGKRRRSCKSEVAAKRQRQPSVESVSDGDGPEPVPPPPVDPAMLLVQPAEPPRRGGGTGKCHPLFDSARQAHAQAQATAGTPAPSQQQAVDTSFAALRHVARFMRAHVGTSASTEAVVRGAVPLPPVDNIMDDADDAICCSFGGCSALGATLPESIEAGTQVVVPAPEVIRTVEEIVPPVNFTVSDAVRIVDDHVRSSGCVELLLGRAAEAAAAVLPPEQRCPLGAAGAMLPGSDRRAALLAHLRRLYASCMLKRVGVRAADYAAARDAAVPVQPPAQAALWVRVYSPSCSLEVSVPASLIATPQPRVVRQLRAFLLEWRVKLLRSAQCHQAPCVAIAAAAAAVVSRLVAARKPAIGLLSRVFRGYAGRRFLCCPPKQKRTRKRRQDAQLLLQDGFKQPRRKVRRPGLFTNELSESTDEEDVQGHQRLRGRKALQQRLRERRNGEGSSDGGEDSDVGSEFAFMARALVIRGGAGVGVTASVLACALEAGFEVREIEPSRKRSRDSVLQSFREATQSRSITARGAPAAEAAKAPIEVVAQPVTQGSKRARNGAVRRGSTKLAAGRAAAVACLVVARAAAAPRGLVVTRRGEHVMLLFESADVVFGDEKGFHAALRVLVDESRCPIVITCNRLTKELEQLCADGDAACVTAFPFPQADSPDVLPPCDEGSSSRQEGEWPGTQLLTPQAGAPVLSLGTALHLGTVLLSEGVLLDAVSLAALVSTFGHDLRRALNTLQFWLGAPPTQGSTPLHVLGINATPRAPPPDLFCTALFGLHRSHCEELAGFLVKGVDTKSAALAGSTPLTSAPFHRLRLAEANYLRLFDGAKLRPQPNPVARRSLQLHSFYSSGRCLSSVDYGETVRFADHWVVRRTEGQAVLHIDGEESPAGVVQSLRYATGSLTATLANVPAPATLPLPPDPETLLINLGGLCSGLATLQGFPQEEELPPQALVPGEEEFDLPRAESQESIQLFAPDSASRPAHPAQGGQQLLPVVPPCLSATDDAPQLGQRPVADSTPATCDFRSGGGEGTATGEWQQCISKGYPDVTASLLDPVRADAVNSCRGFSRLASMLDSWETSRTRAGQVVGDIQSFSGENEEPPEEEAVNGNGLTTERVYNTCSSLALRAVARSAAGRDLAEVLSCVAEPVLAAPLHAYCAQAKSPVFCIPVDSPPGPERVTAACDPLLSLRRRQRRQTAAEARFTSSVHRWSIAPVASRNEWCRTAGELWSRVRSQDACEDDLCRGRLRATMLQFSRGSGEMWDSAAAATGCAVGAVPVP